MQLTSHVKPAPKVESVKTYSDDEETTFINMVNDGAFVEAIAESLGRSVNSIRGKALSLLRAGEINAIPKQEADLDISGMSVEEIADEVGKTVRGVKTMLTRRGLTCADYDGSARKNIG
jgi:DNA-binding NarL/FixJ family response regulator